MKLVYIRHAETEYSALNKFAGRLDLPITGFNYHALNASIELVASHKPTYIICSPLKRAMQTSCTFIDKFEFRTENIIVDPLLIERDFGPYEGLTKTVKNRELLEKSDGVEDASNLEKRATLFLDKYRDKKDTLLIIGHSAFYRELIEHFPSSNEIKKRLLCCEGQLLVNTNI